MEREGGIIMYMYISNKFCVHSHNAAKGFLFSPPLSEMFVIL